MLPQAEDRLATGMGKDGIFGCSCYFSNATQFDYLLKIVSQWVAQIYAHNGAIPPCSLLCKGDG